MQGDGLRTTALTAGLAVAIACAGAPRHGIRPPVLQSLTLAGEFDVPRPAASDPLYAARFGGISALAFDPSTGDLLGLSDDSDDPRIFILRVSGEGPSFRVDPKAYFPLPTRPVTMAPDGSDRAPVALDPEGLAVSRSGRIFVSSEGLLNRTPRVPPGIYEYSRHVAFVRPLPLPRKFLPPTDGALTRGVRPNASFESLTLTPDDQRLFTATESSLLQDGPTADFTHGAPSRIVEYVARDGTFVPAREFAYEVDPVAKPDFQPRFSINGLVELLAFNETDLLSMERSYAEETSRGPSLNRIRIYRVSLRGATDVSRLESLQDAAGIQPARKTLLLDFSDLRGLSPALSALDNFEGLAFGPQGPSGSSFILVSDDNFNDRQKTAFLLLRGRGRR